MLGPAVDGGFYLLGLTQLPPQLFQVSPLLPMQGVLALNSSVSGSKWFSASTKPARHTVGLTSPSANTQSIHYLMLGEPLVKHRCCERGQRGAVTWAACSSVALD